LLLFENNNGIVSINGIISNINPLVLYLKMSVWQVF